MSVFFIFTCTYIQNGTICELNSLQHERIHPKVYLHVFAVHIILQKSTVMYGLKMNGESMVAGAID